MTILVSIMNYINDVDYLMEDLCKRLSIIYPRVNYSKHLITIPDSDIQIVFKPTKQEYIKGLRPDYYYTNSYDVDKYLRACGCEQLQNFTELTNVILNECMNQWRTNTND